MEQMLDTFHEKYGSSAREVVRSPLRVCPLGAHVDHQDGIVTGMALDESVDLAFAANTDGYVRVQSADFPDEEYFHLDEVPSMIPTYWGNYLRGAVLSLRRRYKLSVGINGVVQGKLPIGGLSSSAAVTTAYLKALARVNNLAISDDELIQFSHWVEREFIGLNNGILDQSANILSRNGYLMRMDCRTGISELVPRSPDLAEFEIVIVYSGISTILIKTDYNNRVDECKVAAWLLQELGGLGISSFREVKLRDIPEEVFQTHKEELPGRFRRRAEHFFSELRRVEDGISAWSSGDIETLGQQIFASGESSIYNYESGCPELITIYEALRNAPGVYGARFSGAGYRGACIGLIDPSRREEIAEAIHRSYPVTHPAFKDQYRVFFGRTDDGARIVPV